MDDLTDAELDSALADAEAELRRIQTAQRTRSANAAITYRLRLVAEDALRIRSRIEHWSEARRDAELRSLVPCEACSGHGYHPQQRTQVQA